METIYPSLTRAGLTQNYLHTNSTTHEFLFGALAELVDNARDAAATKINVYSVPNKTLRGGFMLNFLDDGEGMSPTDVANIVQFGKSFKRSASNQMIGQYGNGLKSGSMRIGNDFILFTKKGHDLTCLMLSRTFHDNENIDSIIVPMPVWSCDNRRPILQTGGRERYEAELKLILKYSPFKSEKEVLKQFENIKEQTGTLIIIYNLKLLDSGEPELDVESNGSDIRMAEMDPDDDSNWPERVSFKAYASILYLDPRMKVYVQGKKIRTKRLACTLYKPKMYKFTSSRFKKRSEEEVAKAEQAYRIADEKAKEAESVSRDLEKRLSLKAKPTKEELMSLRLTQDKAIGVRKVAQTKRDVANFKKKALKDKKTLDFVFGFNLEHRKYYGMFVYNCSRLIRMYERVGPQMNGGINCAGIIGVVNVPYLVLEPTHNKQHFADNKEYRHLLKAMGDHLQCYWNDSKITAGKGVKGFWENFGYLTDSWGDSPSNEMKYCRYRAMHIPKVIQCDGCLKWRTIPFQSHLVSKEQPDNWICSMNPDTSHNRCQCQESLPQVAVGEFSKEFKTTEQKKMEIEDKMEKMQRELNKVSKLQTVTSSRDAFHKLSSAAIERRKTFSSSEEEEEYLDPRMGDDDDYSPPNREREARDFMTPTSGGFKRKGGGHRLVARKSGSNLPSKYSSVPYKKTRIEIGGKRVDWSSDEEGIVEYREKNGQANNYNNKVEETWVGKKVEVNISGKWRQGRIISVRHNKDQPTKYKVKFDQHMQDKFDKWCEEGPSLRIISKSDLIMNGAKSPTKIKRINSAESSTPSSSHARIDNTILELHENALGKLRTCLRYFLPPQWKMPKEEINNLTLKELVDFPMDDFFDHYEKGLRRLVSNFRSQADQQRTVADSATEELKETKLLLIQLLNKFDKDTPEMETEDVVIYTKSYLENTT